MTEETIDWETRKQPEIYKPLIDEALLRIARASGGDEAKTSEILEAQAPDGGPWTYLNDVVPEVRDSIVTDALSEVMQGQWAFQFLEGTIDRYLETWDYVESADDYQPDPMSMGGMPVILEYYPEESHECLRQCHYIGGADADIIALWDREDRTSVCHAHMEGFWILGEDPADYIENIADKVEEGLGA
jgi:hypothetical protein